MVEEPRFREAHRDAVPVGCRDHVVVADGAAGLHDVGDAGPVGALDIVYLQIHQHTILLKIRGQI